MGTKRLVRVLNVVGVLALVLSVWLMQGCVSAEYDRRTGKVSYYRFGPQKMAGVSVKLPDGSKVVIENAEADIEAIVEKLAELGMTLATGSAPGGQAGGAVSFYVPGPMKYVQVEYLQPVSHPKRYIGVAGDKKTLPEAVAEQMITAGLARKLK